MKTTQTYYHPRKEGEDILTYTKRTKANTSYLKELKESPEEVNNYYQEYAPKVKHWVTVALSKNNVIDYIDDVTQEIWARVVAYKDTYDPAKPFEGWLNKITQNVLADKLTELTEDRNTHTSYEWLIEQGWEPIDDNMPSPEETLERKQQIVKFMKSLSPQEGQVMSLLMDGASVSEIATELELTEKAVSRTSERIRDKTGDFFKK